MKEIVIRIKVPDSSDPEMPQAQLENRDTMLEALLGYCQDQHTVGKEALREVEEDPWHYNDIATTAAEMAYIASLPVGTQRIQIFSLRGTVLLDLPANSYDLKIDTEMLLPKEDNNGDE